MRQRTQRNLICHRDTEYTEFRMNILLPSGPRTTGNRLCLGRMERCKLVRVV
jgi:hypothetical protein